MPTLLITKETGDYWSFVVDGDTANEILNFRNDLLTIGDQCHFKTSNGANLIKNQQIYPTDITVVASGTFTFTTKEQLFNKLIEKGFFDWISDGSGGGSGVDRFDDLTDTFKYIGKDGYAVVVDETQLRLIAVPFNNVSKSTDLTDMPSVIVGSKMLVTKADESGYEYAELPATPDTLLSNIGWFVYDDLPSAPTSFPALTSTKITNNSNGSETDYSNSPYGVSKVWNSVDDQIDLSDLSIGDSLDLTLKLNFTIPSGTGNFYIEMRLAVGSPYERTRIIHSGYIPAGTYSEEFYYGFSVRNAEEIFYPSELYIKSENAGSLTGNEMYFRVVKNNVNTTTIVDDSHYRGKFPTELALNTALPTANDGDYALVDDGGTTVLQYLWNSADGVWTLSSGVIPTKTSDLTNDGANGIDPFITKVDAAPKIKDGFAGVTAGFAVGQLNYTLPAGSVIIDVYVAHGKQYKTTANNASLTTRWSYSGTTLTITKSPALNNYVYIEYI